MQKMGQKEKKETDAQRYHRNYKVCMFCFDTLYHKSANKHHQFHLV